jgi:DNA invertase Pin-like site-specific DNA recombinase
LVRVSTDRQEKQGESLVVQKKQNAKDVETVGGRIVEEYGGAEHATPNWERKELERLLADAARNRFDALIVAYPDRWSRDNSKSAQGLEVFKKHGIRFFVGTKESDLFNPQDVFIININSAVGQLQANSQNKKAMLSKIERARSGRPSGGGKVPFGRVFDKQTLKWSIDKKKQAIIEDVAARYLAGESLDKLANEYHMDRSGLQRILTKRSGDTWVQTFESKDLNIFEEIETKIPQLLPEKIIKAIQHRTEANRTYTHGQPTHDYLLARMIFCAHCGWTMFGQSAGEHGQHRYYRHSHCTKIRGKQDKDKATWHVREGVRAELASTCKRFSVKAADLEQAVFKDLFELFGNPAAIQRAIHEAFPNADKVESLRDRQKRLEESLAKIEKAITRTIRLMNDEHMEEKHAVKELAKLQADEAEKKSQLDRVNEQLGDVPSRKIINEAARQIVTTFKSWGPIWHKTIVNDTPTQTSWADKRALCEMAFGGKQADGRPLGVYVERTDGHGKARFWNYRIFGMLDVSMKGRSDSKLDEDFVGGRRQRELLTKGINP